MPSPFPTILTDSQGSDALQYMRNKMKNKTITHTEGALVWAVMKHINEEPKTKKVRLRSLVHNFAEALLLRDAMVKSFPHLDAFDYPTDEEIGALVEKVWMLTIAVGDECDRPCSL